MKIAVIIGSLRNESYNRKTALNLIQLAPKNLKLEMIEVGSLPFYNEDLEGQQTPETWKIFRENILSFDGVIFVTPEYNRSIPAVMKNAIDVGSRPLEKNIWKGKPAAVVSVTTGATGAFGANHHLRQTLVAIDMPTLQQPEMYIGKAKDLFDANGKLAHEKTQEFFIKFLHAYADWAKKILA